MERLRDIFNNCEHSSDKWEPYFNIYEKHIIPFIFLPARPVTIVEVGVQKGGSLEMWSKYLPANSRIIGIDIDPDCAKIQYSQPNIEVIIGDQSDPQFWNTFLGKVKDIDIFIDDGGHYMEQQINTFKAVFPKLKTPGLYICEDTHTSFMPSNGGGVGNPNSFLEFAKQLVDDTHYNWREGNNSNLWRNHELTEGKLRSVTFYDSVVVFNKNEPEVMKRVAPKSFNPPK
jgi:hypothetical protein